MNMVLIREALLHAEQTCRYHGTNFEASGTRHGVPRCESCRQPWRVVAALRELEEEGGQLDRLERELRALLPVAVRLSHQENWSPRQLSDRVVRVVMTCARSMASSGAPS